MGRDVHEHSHSGDDHCKKAISNYSSSQHKDDHHEHNQDHDHDNSHGHGHHDVKLKKKNICRCCHLSNTTRLAMQVILTFGFFLVELVVGHVTKSVSMTADSFHMLSDVLALLVGLASAIIATRKTTKNTFGWVRAELLGSLINSVFLVSLCFSILIEAIERFFKKEEIERKELLLYVGLAGLAINLIGLFVIGHGHNHNHSHLPSEESIYIELNEMSRINEDNTNVSSPINNTDESENEKKNSNKNIIYQINVVNESKPPDENNIEAKSLLNVANRANDIATDDAASVNINSNLQISSKNNLLNSNFQSPSLSLSSPSPSLSDKRKMIDDTQPPKISVGTTKSKSGCCSILGKNANSNIKAVFLHILADTLGSIAVIISSLINIHNEKLHLQVIVDYIDPFLSLVLVTIILCITIPLLKKTALILLQTVPKDINVEQIKKDLIAQIPGILSVHEMHIWELSDKKIIATAHITCESSASYMEIAQKLKIFFHERHIHSTTIQPEFKDHLEILDEECRLECSKACNMNTCCGGGDKQLSSQRSLNRLKKNQNSSAVIPTADFNNSKYDDSFSRSRRAKSEPKSDNNTTNNKNKQEVVKKSPTNGGSGHFFSSNDGAQSSPKTITTAHPNNNNSDNNNKISTDDAENATNS